MYVYRVGGELTAGHAAPWTFLTFIPGASNIVKLVGIEIASNGPNSLGAVEWQLGQLSADVTGTGFTPIPWDQVGARAATLTAKSTVTADTGTLSNVVIKLALQQITSKTIWFPSDSRPQWSGTNPIGLRKTVGADTFTWDVAVYLSEG